MLKPRQYRSFVLNTHIFNVWGVEISSWVCKNSVFKTQSYNVKKNAGYKLHIEISFATKSKKVFKKVLQKLFYFN